MFGPVYPLLSLPASASAPTRAHAWKVVASCCVNTLRAFDARIHMHGRASVGDPRKGNRARALETERTSNGISYPGSSEAADARIINVTAYMTSTSRTLADAWLQIKVKPFPYEISFGRLIPFSVPFISFVHVLFVHVHFVSQIVKSMRLIIIYPRPRYNANSLKST